ncbi:hypothetical protein X975_17089, partial [Stegodyphus mimosarum]
MMKSSTMDIAVTAATFMIQRSLPKKARRVPCLQVQSLASRLLV